MQRGGGLLPKRRGVCLRYRRMNTGRIFRINTETSFVFEQLQV
jgi:hypothetical protein